MKAGNRRSHAYSNAWLIIGGQKIVSEVVTVDGNGCLQVIATG